MQAQSGTPRLILLLAALAAFVPLSIDTYLPSLPAIARELGSSAALVQMTIGVFLGGLCLGMLAYGPLSDRYGRRPLLLGGIALYIVASLGCMLTQSVEQLLVCRFVQALGGASALVLARAVVRDLFPLGQAARVLSLMQLITMVATLVAPMTGTWLVLIDGWRSIFLALLLLALICWLATALWLKESHAPAQRSASVGAAFAGYLSVLGHRQAMSFILCMGFSSGGIFAFVTASPFVFIEHFGFSPRAFAWVFALNILGIILASVINARQVNQVGPLAMLKVGAWVAALAGLALTAAGLLGWAIPAVIIVCVVLYMTTAGLIGANCTASLMALFQRQAGAAVGLAVAVQFASGMAFSWMVSAFADGTPVPLCVALGIGGVGCLLGFWGISEEQAEGEPARR
ncbi:multidrug effflux MFS transporter [Pseudomonas baltica]|uniref:multidrug effflux MFS transporter n=1 Tax=Pseudomonas baltica TaxID=2762576 RepID=UPI00289E842A|nr:multidrug effflux MFS transporter [Pseudomonas baltica]